MFVRARPLDDYAAKLDELATRPAAEG